MDSVTQHPHYDEERIREYADEGEETLREMNPVCARCTDEAVRSHGDLCGYCTEEANDIAAMELLSVVAHGVEVKCALSALTRAMRHIAKGRYHTPALQSLAIQILTEAA